MPLSDYINNFLGAFTNNQANYDAQNVDYTPNSSYLGFGNNNLNSSGYDVGGFSNANPLDPAQTGGTALGILMKQGLTIDQAQAIISAQSSFSGQVPQFNANGLNQNTAPITPSADSSTYLPSLNGVTYNAPNTGTWANIVNGGAQILNSPQGIINTVAGTNLAAPGLGWAANGIVGLLGGGTSSVTQPGVQGGLTDFSGSNVFNNIGGSLVGGGWGTDGSGLSGMGDGSLLNASAGINAPSIYNGSGIVPGSANDPNSAYYVPGNGASNNVAATSPTLPTTPGVTTLPPYNVNSSPITTSPTLGGGATPGLGGNPGVSTLPPYTVTAPPVAPTNPTTPPAITTPTIPTTPIPDPTAITPPAVTTPGGTPAATSPTVPTTPTTDVGGGGNGGVSTASSTGDRNALTEGTAQNLAESSLAPQQYNQYAAYAPAYASADAASTGAYLFGQGGPTTLAGQAAALTAGQQDPLLNMQNQVALQQLGLGGQLSASDLRNVQQSSRAGFAARGLDATNASVVDESMQTDAANRARLLQSLGIAQNVVGQNQSQENINNAFTTNLLGQAQNATQASNATTRAQFDPFSNYGMDLANTNYNAGQARQISANNNALALTIAGQNSSAAQSAATTSALGNIFSGWLGRCWVAREVFGATNPEWIMYRAWLDTKAPRWFVKLYVTYGPGFAVFLRKHPSLKTPIRWWMRSRIATLNLKVAHAL